ncbi:MAG TPA: hypothetical protein VNU97_04015 [Rhizomicrobium sp.]|jgi:hypothetical protein|nr:hypothetical protein [Rhizomicrobium sp.]
MGVARLLAKGWVVFCLFAGAHAVALALGRGEAPLDALREIGVCVLLFGAMGLLFVGGFGASSGLGGRPLLARLKPHHLMPGFNEMVFLAFVILSFVDQVFVAPAALGSAPAAALQNALFFVVPGQRALATALGACALDGGRLFACAFTWLLAIVFVASAASRIGLTAGLLRLERMVRPSSFGPTLLAALYGVVAIVAFQLLFVGSAYPWLACSAFTDITGALLIGLAPLMLAYLIVAALATLRASGPAQ